MNVGQRIKQKRKALKMSADELGELLGKDRSTIYRYENGEIENLPLDILEPIAKALQTTPQYLMGWEETQKTNNDISNIVARLRTDEDLLALVTVLCRLDKEKIKNVKTMIESFLK